MPSFKAMVVFTIGNSVNLRDKHQEICETLGHHYNEKEAFTDSARTYGVYKNGTGIKVCNVLIKEHDMNHGIIAHEIRHAVDRLMKYIDLPNNQVTEEVYAYLTEYVTNVFYVNIYEDGGRLVGILQDSISNFRANFMSN